MSCVHGLDDKIVRMAILSVLIHRANTIPIKIPGGLCFTQKLTGRLWKFTEIQGT